MFRSVIDDSECHGAEPPRWSTRLEFSGRPWSSFRPNPSRALTVIQYIRSSTTSPSRRIHTTEAIRWFPCWQSYRQRCPPPRASPIKKITCVPELFILLLTWVVCLPQGFINPGERIVLGDWKMESDRSSSLINLDVMAVNKEWLHLAAQTFLAKNSFTFTHAKRAFSFQAYMNSVFMPFYQHRLKRITLPLSLHSSMDYSPMTLSTRFLRW
jgi:hypothetical protein